MKVTLQHKIESINDPQVLKSHLKQVCYYKQSNDSDLKRKKKVVN